MPNHVEGDDLALDTALPRLSEFGSQLLVPFTVNRLPRPSVLWLNCRWFRRQGLCVAPNTTSRRQVETILLDNFAYLVAAQKGDDGFSGSKVVFADRYGDPGGLSPHGGSGRVASAPGWTGPIGWPRWACRRPSPNRVPGWLSANTTR